VATARTRSRTPLHVEFSLPFLIEASGIEARTAKLRLNGLENAISTLARPWRPRLPIAPARELRMAAATRGKWLEWIEVDDGYDPHTIARLGVYASGAVVDDDVPEGWVRLVLR
jgi:hypothetical protein